MRVAFDLDGVLYPWTTACWEYCSRAGFTKLSKVDFFKKTEQKNSLFWDNIIKDPIILETFPPTNQLRDFMRRVGRKHQVYYITSRPIEVERVTQRYLKKYDFPDWENLYFSHDKDMEIVKFNIAALIEDNYRNAEKCAKHCASYLINTPWNQKEVSDPRIVRVDNLFELEGVFC
jgi:uncharacterized HAD superfamily protein